MTEKPREADSGSHRRYRMYLDESGDHVMGSFATHNQRFLCLLGCWFRDDDYVEYADALRELKREYLDADPDEPVVLHREDMIDRRGPFWKLRDPHVCAAFDDQLLNLIATARFSMVAVVIDKQALVSKFADAAAHPYHLALGFLLQRYCGYLGRLGHCGDVMAESRGGREDRLLKDSYDRVYRSGVWMNRAPFFQAALSSSRLKLKTKSANIAGLQLADLLCHPVKHYVLALVRNLTPPTAPFASRLMGVARTKFNYRLGDGRVEGYGYVIYPK